MASEPDFSDMHAAGLNVDLSKLGGFFLDAISGFVNCMKNTGGDFQMSLFIGLTIAVLSLLFSGIIFATLIAAKVAAGTAALSTTFISLFAGAWIGNSLSCK